MANSPTLPDRDVLVALNRSTTAARLLSGVVHDVNNALQVISGTVELLSNRTDLPAAVGPSLERLGRQTARAAAVLADVQRFTRGDLAETGRVNLREVVEHSLALRAFAIKRANLTTKLQASDSQQYFVNGNRAQMQQALLNLIMNAEQALAGGTGEILIELTADSQSVLVRVSDRGQGVAVDPTERAFDPFVTTRTPWEGAGLGLWAARMIAEQFGGAVTLDSGPNGTAATLSFPAAG